MGGLVALCGLALSGRAYWSVATDD